jgi:hypothetical protein
VLWNPRFVDVGNVVMKRVVQCDVWRVGSGAKGDAQFHAKFCDDLVKHYRPKLKALPASPKFTRLLMFTDRCAKQYSGHRTFRMISEFYERHKVEMWHYMAEPGDFKGPHDNYGKDPRNAAARAEREGKARLHNIKLYMDWCKKNMKEPSKSSRNRKKRDPTRMFGADTFVWGLYEIDDLEKRNLDFNRLKIARYISFLLARAKRDLFGFALCHVHVTSVSSLTCWGANFLMISQENGNMFR